MSFHLPSSFDHSINRNYLFLFAFFGVIFSVIPMVTRNVIPYDMIENLYWGKEWQLGYAKHPPLFAWTSYIFYRICGSIPESLYILTQLNLLLGMFFVFKIAQMVLQDDEKACASVAIFLCSGAAVFGNEKFNATTILMSLLPAMYYFFLRMMKFREMCDAVLLGIFTALAILGKYFALLFVGCMGLFLLSDKKNRELLKTPLPYVAAAVTLLGISWHIYWMFDSNFITLKYGLDKSINSRNFASGFNFLMMQIIFFCTSFVAAFFASSRSKNAGEKNRIHFIIHKNQYLAMPMDQKFVVFITIVPNALLAAVSLTSGMRIGSFWGVNMCMLLGIYILLLNKNIDVKKLFDVAKDIFIIFAALIFLKLGPARQIAKNYFPDEAINIQKVAYCIENEWFNLFGYEPIKRLHADKSTAALHIYLSYSPQFYDPTRYDQFHIYPPDKSIKEKVLMTFLFKEGDGAVEKFHDAYDDQVIYDGLVHVIDDHYIYYAFVGEQQDDDDEDTDNEEDNKNRGTTQQDRKQDGGGKKRHSNEKSRN